jgi:hypothetical protein
MSERMQVLAVEMGRARMHYENLGFANCAGLDEDKRAELDAAYALAGARYRAAQRALDDYAALTVNTTAPNSAKEG